MADEMTKNLSELTNLPIGDMIRSIALGIAEAQFQLDKSSMTVAELMSGQRLLRNLDTGKLIDASGAETDKPVIVDSRVYFGFHYDETGKRVPDLVSLMELGFTPTFYQFVDTVIEIKVTLKASKSQQTPAQSGQAGQMWGSTSQYSLTSTPIDAGYTSAYSFQAELASTIRTKIVPVPPPALLEDRIRMVLKQAAEPPPVVAPAPAVPVDSGAPND